MPLKLIILLITSFISFITHFMGSSLNVALPQIGKDFIVNVSALTWINTSFILSSVTTLIPIGFIADNYEKKFFLNMGIFLFLFTALLAGATNSFTFLIIVRFVQGIAGSMIIATTIPILLSYFDVSEQGKILGINIASIYLGLSLGPVMGGIVVEYFHWRWIFWGISPFLLIALLMSIFLIQKEFKKISNPFRLDLVEILLYIISVLLLTYGLSWFRNFDAKIISFIGLFLFFLFLYKEARKHNPIFPLYLFKTNHNFMSSNIVALINYSATFGISFLLNIYLQNILNYSPKTVGFILLIIPMFQFLVSPFAGKLSDQFEPKYIVSLGMLMTTASLLGFCFLTFNTYLLFIILNMLLLGTSFGIFSSPNTNAIMRSVPKELHSLASSTLGTMRLMGQLISMTIISIIFSYLIYNTPLIKADTYLILKSIKIIFLIFSILCFMGVILSISKKVINN